MRNSTLTNSHSTGEVVATRQYAGGIVGYMVDNSTLTVNYSTGKVTAESSAGGIVGSMRNSTLTNSHSTGEVVATRQ
jgi:hypothetical protein